MITNDFNISHLIIAINYSLSYYLLPITYSYYSLPINHSLLIAHCSLPATYSILLFVTPFPRVFRTHTAYLIHMSVYLLFNNQYIIFMHKHQSIIIIIFNIVNCQMTTNILTN
ncbi:hypothetical protein GLOIN_2v179041 [Rhizophagus irregularis DAOM 181602=DAOM 197198]|uniref:Uncharacterized protein n=1 Tax=Rhizophagus irregularis (strain DAOM 181602 / DAOM 197198 / MUCL 43194) TaxID=747089 RepID=A0A2P4PVN5_RHIID|nr:hypothetical protein GLOIN_2v179041 [Rhizophagus irregularis DAOM 181602=DAOM 197198]POG69428.1 hypothetical protein GLOIN_2v179041 [Rhizophagus irregularis DAOM 181602=DAOM 197198]|eukprot:XP_025176294.1 hypothetical protein GLOIN_2v179041 [Rhizophagus irregularis DAOM 181602=DAOM 197198]